MKDMEIIAMLVANMVKDSTRLTHEDLRLRAIKVAEAAYELGWADAITKAKAIQARTEVGREPV